MDRPGSVDGGATCRRSEPGNGVRESGFPGLPFSAAALLAVRAAAADTDSVPLWHLVREVPAPRERATLTGPSGACHGLARVYTLPLRGCLACGVVPSPREHTHTPPLPTSDEEVLWRRGRHVGQRSERAPAVTEQCKQHAQSRPTSPRANAPSNTPWNRRRLAAHTPVQPATAVL